MKAGIFLDCSAVHFDHRGHTQNRPKLAKKCHFWHFFLSNLSNIPKLTFLRGVGPRGPHNFFDPLSNPPPPRSQDRGYRSLDTGGGGHLSQ